MGKLIKTAILLSCMAMFTNVLYSETPSKGIFDAVRDYTKNNQKKDCLTVPMLKSANEIIYGFSSGALSPKYAYYGTIVVTPNSVTLKIINMSTLRYTKTCKLTAKRYSNFLTHLYRLGVKKNSEEHIPMCGSGTCSITIKKDGKTIFEGVELEDIITANGMLSDAFEPLLSHDMQMVFEDPSSTFE